MMGHEGVRHLHGTTVVGLMASHFVLHHLQTSPLFFFLVKIAIIILLIVAGVIWRKRG